MKIRRLSTRNPHYILGVPPFASARQIRSAYAKRIELLNPYRFDKTTQPMEWQVVNDILHELNDAYTQLRPAKTGRIVLR